MAKGATYMKKFSIFALLGLAVIGVYVVNWSHRIGISNPPAELTVVLDPIAAAYIPPSGGTDKECNDLLQTIGAESMLASDGARAIKEEAQKDFRTKCMGGK